MEKAERKLSDLFRLIDMYVDTFFPDNQNKEDIAQDLKMEIIIHKNDLENYSVSVIFNERIVKKAANIALVYELDENLDSLYDHMDMAIPDFTVEFDRMSVIDELFRAKALYPRLRLIVSEHFLNNRTLEDIANEFGVSTNAISVANKKALFILHNYVKSNIGLDIYHELI